MGTIIFTTHTPRASSYEICVFKLKKEIEISIRFLVSHYSNVLIRKYLP